MPHLAGKRPPYTELSLGRIREIHDRVYFGRWRDGSATDHDLEETRRQLSEFVGLLVGEVEAQPPPDLGGYLEKTLAAHGDVQTLQDSELFQAINNTLSYGHRLLNFLLRAKGEPNHVSRDFAVYHESSGDGDE
jgi:hypothetical protein